MIFKDKTVIITGGSEGVGAATARMFAAAGANLVLVARNKKNLEAIALELRELTRVEIIAMDVSDADACVDLFKKANFEFDRIDILVNNAGFHARGPFEQIDVADLATMIDVNLRAPVVLTRLALPHMRDGGGGVIINVGSLAGRTYMPNSATYAASKAGLRSLTYSLGDEYIGKKIRFAIVSPGPVETNFSMRDLDNTADINFSQPVSKAEDVAQVILDLCGNNQREAVMFRMGGVLTTASYVMPWFARWLRPIMERRGARIKAKLKQQR